MSGIIKDHRTLMRVGMLSLVVGAISIRYLHRIPGMSEDLADGLSGMFYGIAIGGMLLSMRMKHRSRGGEDVRGRV